MSRCGPGLLWAAPVLAELVEAAADEREAVQDLAAALRWRVLVEAVLAPAEQAA